MKFILPLSIAALAGLSSATPINANKRDTPLTIELTSTGNSALKAVITNTGSEDLNLLKTGTLLDDVATEKVQVHNAKGKLAFNGVRLRVATSGLNQDNFVSLAAGKTLELDIEAAALHDLTEGGDFDIVSEGALPYALGNSTDLEGAALPFFSNKLSVKVDGAKAAKVASALKSKRSTVQSDCTGDELTATTTALSNCAKLASAAAAAASSDSTLFNVYFKSSSNVEEVVARLEAVAEECSSSTSGVTKSSCTDSEGACSNGVLAYTLPSTGLVVNCPLYFSDLSALSTRCHGQDQATTTLHEMTHANAVYNPGTDDLGYGFSAATALSASQSVNNADSYALFANAVYVGTSCGASSDVSDGVSATASTPSTPASSSEASEPSETASETFGLPTGLPTGFPFPSETPSLPTGGIPFPTGTGLPTGLPIPTGTGLPSLPSFTFTPTLPTALPTGSSSAEDPTNGGFSWDDWMEWISQFINSQRRKSKSKSKSNHN